jgi:hypothetical protein
MRRNAWMLLIALLLQLFAGSAWAWRGLQASGAAHDHAAHCHGTATEQTVVSDAPHASHSSSPSGLQTDSHHCCAVGLGSHLQPQLPPLPQATPASQHGPWASQSLQPDLRPPI